MSRARRALVPVLAFASLLLQASSAAATLAPAPAAPWATANGRVLAIVRVNNVVYVGGKFTQMIDTDGTVLARNHLAAVSAVDGHVLPWNPGANGTVRSMAVSIDGTTVYIGGDFTALGGKARAHAAAMAAIAPGSTTTTGTLRSWSPNADGSVYSLDQIGSRVYLGGAFLHVGGHGRPRLASVSAASGALTSWHPKVDGAVRALLPAAGGSTLFIGGSFHHVNGTSVAHLASIDPTTARLHPWRSHTGDTILALAENGTYLYAGDRGGGGHVRSFVLSTGKLRWTETTNGNVNTVALVGSGASQQLVLGGHFTKVGSQVRHKVALISPITGLVDRSPGAWHPAAAGSDLGVYSELAYGQHIYFGGDFLEWQVHPGVVEQSHLAVFSTTAPADVTPPVVTAPVATIANGATLGASKVPLRLTWKASDPGSGVCRSDVRRRFSGNAVRGGAADARHLAVGDDAGGSRLEGVPLLGVRDGLLRPHVGDRHLGARPSARLPELEPVDRLPRRLEPQPGSERLRRVGAPVGPGRRQRVAPVHRPRDRLGGVEDAHERQRPRADRRPLGGHRAPARDDVGPAPGGVHPHLVDGRSAHDQDRRARDAVAPARLARRPARPAVSRGRLAASAEGERRVFKPAVRREPLPRRPIPPWCCASPSCSCPSTRRRSAAANGRRPMRSTDRWGCASPGSPRPRRPPG